MALNTCPHCTEQPSDQTEQCNHRSKSAETTAQQTDQTPPTSLAKKTY